MTDGILKKRATAAVLFLGLLAAPSSLGGQEVALPLGTQAPDAALQDLDGNPVQLLDYVKAGKPTLIEFWASWCENCEALQPQLDQIQERWGSEVNIIAVAVAVSQTLRRVNRHVADHDPGYPYLWDGSGEAVRAYNVAGTSIVVLLDAEGRVAYTGTGRSQDLIAAVEPFVGKDR